MGAIGNLVTLVDLARRLDPEGKIQAIAELLNETNEILDDMLWKEGNLITGEKTTVRTGLPSGTWRKLNYGVQPTKSTTKQITDACGMLEAYAEVDKKLADLNGNTPEFRLSEDRAFLEGLNQDMAETLFYGDTDADPEKFMGLAPRYSSLSAASGANIVSAAGSGNTNTSIWLVSWGYDTTYGIYPKGSKGGFQHDDLGQQTLFDTATPPGRFEGYRTHYMWECGLTVRDWRQNVRIANIKVGDLTKTGSSGADLVDLMVQAIERRPGTKMGNPVFYCNQTVRSYLRRQIANKSNVWLSMNEVGGKPVMMFGDIPVKRCDQLLNTEATVS